MAKLNYNLWSARKNMNAEKIVQLGIVTEEDLDAFLSVRNVQMPEDMAEFEQLWKKAQSSSNTKKSESMTKNANNCKTAIKHQTKEKRTQRLYMRQKLKRTFPTRYPN